MLGESALLLLVSGKMSQMLTSFSLTGKDFFPSEYRLANEKIPAIICK